jgi:hypothetical protein
LAEAHQVLSSATRGRGGQGRSGGEYGCTGLAALSAGGNEVAFEDVPNLRFRVFPEPSRRPHIAGAISLGPQQDMFDVGRYDPEKDEFIRPKYDRATGQCVDPE